MKTIDLGLYNSSSTFSGRSRGKAIREKCKFDDLDQTIDEVKILIPGNTDSLHSSFLLGLLGKSIRKLGLEQFEKKYIFEGYNKHAKEIEEAKTRALLISDILKGEEQ